MQTELRFKSTDATNLELRGIFIPIGSNQPRLIKFNTLGPLLRVKWSVSSGVGAPVVTSPDDAIHASSRSDNTWATFTPSIVREVVRTHGRRSVR